MSKAPVPRSKPRSVSVDLATGRALEARRVEADKRFKKAAKDFESATAKAKKREEELAVARAEVESVNAEMVAFVKSNTAALLSDERAFQLLLEVGGEGEVEADDASEGSPPLPL